MSKKCKIGINCGNTCIESKDACTKSLSSKAKPILKKIDSARRAATGSRGNRDVQQKTRDEIISKASMLFSSDAANKMFADAASNYKSKGDVQLMGDIRHQLNGGEYDRILDSARAKSGLDNRSWNKVYNSAKNAINGMILKGILDSKGNC